MRSHLTLLAKWSKQDPAASERAENGSPVVLTVSGFPPVAIPALAGLDREDAEKALITARLNPGAVMQSYDAAVAVGVVVSQTPTAGSEVFRDSDVALVISKGPEPVVVPKLKGKTQAKATKALEDAGFKVKAKKKYSSKKKSTVISVSPNEKTAVPGSKFVITVSKGPAPPRNVSTAGDVTLSGTVVMRSFESEAFDAVDGKVRVPVLVLSAPVNVGKDEFGGPARGVKVMQLAVNTDYDAFKSEYVNRKVTITGGLFHWHTIHHCTEVLLDVGTVKRR